MDRVVPLAVEGVRLELDFGHLFVGDLDAQGIGAVVDLGADPEAGAGRGGSDEAHDGGEAHQRLGAPVHGDVGEETVFDLVPPAGSGREVAERDREPRPVGEPLDLAYRISLMNVYTEGL